MSEKVSVVYTTNGNAKKELKVFNTMTEAIEWVRTTPNVSAQIV